MEDNPYSPPVADIEPPPTEGYELATRLSRLIASIIDGIVMMVILVPVMVASGYIESVTQSGTESMGDVVLWGLAGLAVFIGVNGYFLHHRGQTLGKIAMKIQIVSRKTNDILPLRHILGLRIAPVWAASLVPLIGDLASLVNVLFIFREDRLCVHDMIAGTRVIRYRG